MNIIIFTALFAAQPDADFAPTRKRPIAAVKPAKTVPVNPAKPGPRPKSLSAVKPTQNPPLVAAKSGKRVSDRENWELPPDVIAKLKESLKDIQPSKITEPPILSIQAPDKKPSVDKLVQTPVKKSPAMRVDNVARFYFDNPDGRDVWHKSGNGWVNLGKVTEWTTPTRTPGVQYDFVFWRDGDENSWTYWVRIGEERRVRFK